MKNTAKYKTEKTLPENRSGHLQKWKQKRILVFIILLNYCFLLSAQGVIGFTDSACSSALGGVTVCPGKNASLTGNPAGMNQMERKHFCFFGENRFLLPEINRFCFSAGLPSKRNTWGFKADYFGTISYTELLVSVAFAQKLSQKLDLGLRLGFLMEKMEDKYPGWSYQAEIGFIYRLNETLLFGISIENPSYFVIPHLTSLVALRMGFRKKIHSNIYLYAECSKTKDFPFSIHTGIEYGASENFGIRIGYAYNPVSPAGGFYWKLSDHWSMDLAMKYHPQLGPSFGLQINHLMKEKSN